jgi:ABC-type multidrug transport system fused ATPase/permease subunit
LCFDLTLGSPPSRGGPGAARLAAPTFERRSGAREHNLRNVNLDLPRNRLIVFTGVSGSGKLSLAFDTHPANPDPS